MSTSQQLLLGEGPAAAAGGYQIQRSLRFNSADSAYLNRTPASASNRKTWTWSGWVKLSSNKNQTLFSCVAAQNDTQAFFIDMLSSGVLRVLGWTTVFRSTSAVYSDFSAWYHVVVALDTTQATANDRIKVYVNGSQVTAFGTTNNPTQNTDYGINQAALHEIGRYTASSTGYDYLNGYMTEVNFIDGQALTPSSFGQTNAATGVWEPIAYTGTYGTNGFYLNFSDNSGTTSTTLGKDYSGNGNNWTPNNFSVTAGTGNDSLVDTPTSYGTDTGAGGEVRGNYATLNPLRQATGSGASLANGNLQFTCISSSTGSQTTFATFGVSTGKWYFEMTVGTNSGYYPGIGVNTDLSLAVTSQSGDAASGYMYLRDGSKYNSGSLTSYGASYTTNDVVGVALDMDAGTITFYKNGASQGQAFSGITGTAVPCIVGLSSAAGYLNFGQRPFAYTAPSGFKALVTQNLPTPTVIQGDDYFNTVTYSGTGATQSITGVGFQPDLVWTKSRSNAYSHLNYDVLRGVTKYLSTNSTNAEGTAANSLTAFNSDGFTLGADENSNTNGTTSVAWNWKANGAGSSNTAGIITSTVSANTTAGFSIVTYTGNSTTATVGHGLGVAPAMVIVKNRSYGPAGWIVYHQALGATKYIILNSTAAAGTFNYWNDTAPTSTVFSLYPGSSDDVNNSSYNYVAYCFAPVAGYSAFGSYTGNGSTDGPFCYAGFQPRYLLIKCSSTTGNWVVWDTARNTYNVLGNKLYPNLSNAEASATDLDITSNGFKIRNTTAAFNSNGATYIYAAFAAYPFKYSLGF